MYFPVHHDLHLHSNLSVCCGDENMTPENILRFAEEHGYKTLCLTNHVWSSSVPGPNGFYASQNLEHIRKALPLPQGTRTRFLFGAETEYCGGDRLGLTPADCDTLDFVVIPLNHFHMTDFVCPASCETPGSRAELFMQRFDDLMKLELPWEKVGLAHLTCSLIYREGDPWEVYDLLDEERMLHNFELCADRGVGIELNAGCFLGLREHRYRTLKLYRLARSVGCKFYCASDAHTLEHLRGVPELLPQVVEALGLTDKDVFTLK